jgi:SAM-dependent MidA family methyltransferase
MEGMEDMNDLRAVIQAEIARDGPLTFARFMALALYHPTLGYYCGGGEGREPLGWNGDYFTSGDVSPLWGWALARQLHQMWTLLGRPPRFDVVEAGGGRGLLAREVWRYALSVRAGDETATRDETTGDAEDAEAVIGSSFAAALRYTVVDRASPDAPLLGARRARLTADLAHAAMPADTVRWVESLAEAGPGEAGAGIVGCIVSNELLDALPVHIVQAVEASDGGTALAEGYVDVDAASRRLVERLGPSSTPEVAGYLDSFDIPWRAFGAGWRAEVCLAAPEWMREAACQLRRGFVLTIDYGDTARRLYTRERRCGTLAVYARHQMGERPLARPGRQDLTTHVNFTALVRAGRAAGLRMAGLTTQAAFLDGLGIREAAATLARLRYPAADAAPQSDRGQADLLRRKLLFSALATLLDPGGLGGFKVLVQQRGVPEVGRRLWGLGR